MVIEDYLTKSDKLIKIHKKNESNKEERLYIHVGLLRDYGYDFSIGPMYELINFMNDINDKINCIKDGTAEKNKLYNEVIPYVKEVLSNCVYCFKCSISNKNTVENVFKQYDINTLVLYDYVFTFPYPLGAKGALSSIVKKLALYSRYAESRKILLKGRIYREDLEKKLLSEIKKEDGATSFKEIIDSFLTPFE